jgi:hypothetical protein
VRGCRYGDADEARVSAVLLDPIRSTFLGVDDHVTTPLTT